ncbi:MAG: hypothetical protein KAI66_13630 [Lentisphaeria bacterium]|nr:hypothetical protein [Lentisphaeria bacterium]
MTDLKNRSTGVLRRRRTLLLKQFPPLDAILRGSLIERYKRCGKPGCRCARGRGHGPKFYLSVTHPGSRPQMEYVPQGYQQQVTEQLGNYRRLRAILEEICAINTELLHRRERL